MYHGYVRHSKTPRSKTPRSKTPSLMVPSPKTLCPTTVGQGPVDPAAAWAEWLRRWKWDYWVTVTCGWDPTPEAVERAVGRWWETLRTTAPRCFMAVGIEGGGRGHGHRAHAHVLLGGILTRIRPPWGWTHGRTVGDRYDPRQDPRGTRSGACAYLSKHPEGVVLYGTFQKWRPRR